MSSKLNKLILTVQKHEDDRERLKAIQELLKIHNNEEEVMSLLLDAVEDTYEEIRLWAIMGLGQIGDPIATIPLIDAVENEQYELAFFQAIAALGDMKDKRAVKKLIELLNDGDRDVVIAAAKALGRSGDKQSLEYLEKLVTHSDEEIREHAALAIEKIDKSISAKALVKYYIAR